MRVINHDTGEILSQCPSGLRAFNTAGEIVVLPCDQWGCPYCSRILAWQWASRVRYGIALWPLDAYHWTLTLPGEIYSQDFAFKVLNSAWDNLRKHCQRKMPYFHYAAFVELHPHRVGIAHMHIITLHWSIGRIKDMAHHAGFGYEADETTVSGGLAAYYVSKYTSKQGKDMPKGYRRVRLSRSWPKLPSIPPDDPVLVLARDEPLPEYFIRVSLASKVPTTELQARWLNKDATNG